MGVGVGTRSGSGERRWETGWGTEDQAGIGVVDVRVRGWRSGVGAESRGSGAGRWWSAVERGSVWELWVRGWGTGVGRCAWPQRTWTPMSQVVPPPNGLNHSTVLLALS